MLSLLSLPSAVAATQLPAQPEQMPVRDQDFGASLLHTASQVSGVPCFSTPEPFPQGFIESVLLPLKSQQGYSAILMAVCICRKLRSRRGILS